MSISSTIVFLKTVELKRHTVFQNRSTIAYVDYGSYVTLSLYTPYTVYVTVSFAEFTSQYQAVLRAAVQCQLLY